MAHVSEQRLKTVNCGMTGARHAHQGFNQYVGIGQSKPRKVQDVKGDISHLKEPMLSTFGKAWAEVQTGSTWSDYAHVKVTAASSGTGKFLEAITKVPSYIRTLKETESLLYGGEAAKEDDAIAAKELQEAECDDDAESLIDHGEVIDVDAWVQRSIARWDKIHVKKEGALDVTSVRQFEVLLTRCKQRAKDLHIQAEEQAPQGPSDAEIAEQERLLKAVARKRQRSKEAAEVEYDVEKVTKKRQKNDVIEYYVHWKGFGRGDDTWEPIDNLQSSLKKIAEFNARSEKTKGNAAKRKKKK